MDRHFFPKEIGQARFLLGVPNSQ